MGCNTTSQSLKIITKVSLRVDEVEGGGGGFLIFSIRVFFVVLIMMLPVER